MPPKELIFLKFKEWSVKSTSHGYPKIFTADKLLTKILWIVCFLTAIGSCSFLVVMSVIEYLKFSTNTKTTMIYESNAVFPSITICNMNPFLSPYSSVITNKTTNQFLAFNIAKSKRFGDENRKKLGVPINETILSSYFNYLTPIDYGNFSWYYDYVHGNCYNFNSGFNMKGEKTPLVNVSAVGPYTGLQISLFTGIPLNKNAISLAYGMHIKIYNQSYNLLALEGLNFKPGSLVQIGIRKSIIKNLPQPYSSCIDLTGYTSEIYEFFIRNGKIYRQRDCHQLCLQKLINEACNCSMLIYLEFQDVQECNSLLAIRCALNVILTFSNLLYEKCAEYCPLECETLRYKISYTTAGYPSDFGIDNFRNMPVFRKYDPNRTLTNQQIRETILSVNIYFDELEYSLIEHYPSQTLGDLISSIGGTLGLFLGISILSFVEMLEILIDLVYLLIGSCYKNRKKQNKVIQIQPKY